jgi:hypothetical protein
VFEIGDTVLLKQVNKKGFVTGKTIPFRGIGYSLVNVFCYYYTGNNNEEAYDGRFFGQTRLVLTEKTNTKLIKTAEEVE